MNEKRNTTGESADLFGLVGGVGARQAKKRSQAGGGGYPQTCGVQNFELRDEEKKSGDPRFAELARIGLPAAWLRLAERIGFDTWLDVWRTISEDEALRHDGGQRMPKLRAYDAYLRFQRNRYIEALAQAGMGDQQIQAALRRNLKEDLDVSHINRLSKKARMAA